MDGTHVDRIARRLFVESGRRQLTRSLVALPLAGALGLATSAAPNPARARPVRGKPKRCIAIGLPCNWRRPGECCSGSCRLPWETGRPVGGRPGPDEITVCVEAAFGCKKKQNTCPARGEIRDFPCPGLRNGSCLKSVDGVTFCGNTGGVCEPCKSDRDCVLRHGTGAHCIECQARCHEPGSSNHRACVGEGGAAV